MSCHYYVKLIFDRKLCQINFFIAHSHAKLNCRKLTLLPHKFLTEKIKANVLIGFYIFGCFSLEFAIHGRFSGFKAESFAISSWPKWISLKLTSIKPWPSFLITQEKEVYRALNWSTGQPT